MTSLTTLNCPPLLIGTITRHYHKEGWQNILPNTTSLVKCPAIIVRYE